MKKILIVYQRVWGMRFGQFYIEQIRKEYPNYEIGVLTVKEQADTFFKQNNNLSNFSWYKFFDPVRDFSNEYLGQDNYDIKNICEDLQIPSIWEILYATRNHIKNYKKKFNYAFSPSLSDQELIVTIKAYYKLIQDIDQSFKPDLIIVPNPVESFNIMLEHYARAKSIPCRQLAPTSVKGYYQYVQDKNQGGSKIHKLITLPQTDYQLRKVDAEAYLKEFRDNFIVPECAYHDSSKPLAYDPVKVCKAVAKSFRAILFGKKLPKGLHADHGDWHPLLALRDYFLHVYYYNKVKNINYDPLPENNKFVFFPLQMQPELAIDVLAPYHSNQIEMARLIAMSLPEDYTLVVKDHPIMVGRRRPQYLEKIKRLPNVKLISYDIKTPDILNNAAAIIVTCGSIVFEAAIMGRPVIQLGNLASSFLLPNVTHETDLTKLKSLWPRVLHKTFSGNEYEEKLIKYISLSMEHGIETNYYEMWEQGADGDLMPFWLRLKDDLEDLKIFP